MKPGDLIEWARGNDVESVGETKLIYSSLMKCWVPIGGKMLLIACTDVAYVWLHQKGIFTMHKDDCFSSYEIEVPPFAIKPRLAR